MVNGFAAHNFFKLNVQKCKIAMSRYWCDPSVWGWWFWNQIAGV